MNFLAHCVLGHPDEALMAGGYLGDFVKGPVPSDLPVDLLLSCLQLGPAEVFVMCRSI